jgi:hypothetical protein
MIKSNCFIVPILAIKSNHKKKAIVLLPPYAGFVVGVSISITGRS